MPASTASPFAAFLHPAVDAAFEISRDQKAVHISCHGSWTVHSVQCVERKLLSLPIDPGTQYTIHTENLARLDTTGALLLNQFRSHIASSGGTSSLAALSPLVSSLLETAALPSPPDIAKPSAPAWFFLYELGLFVSALFAIWGEQLGFIGKYIVVVVRLLAQPKRMRWTSLVFHMEQVGLRAVPIVSLLTFLIGMVVAYMGSQELARFGAQVFTLRLLDITVMREMGVLITAIVVAGRSSSSFTAQIGAMVANEEVAALQVLGLSPMEILVVPRVLALTLTLPLLVFLGDLMALFGGACALWYDMDMSLHGFLVQYQDVCNVNHFLVGMVKTPFFAVVIGIVGCYQGFKATENAESIGFLTTKAVVQAIFFVIIFDAFFAILFTTLRI